MTNNRVGTAGTLSIRSHRAGPRPQKECLASDTKAQGSGSCSGSDNFSCQRNWDSWLAISSNKQLWHSRKHSVLYWYSFRDTDKPRWRAWGLRQTSLLRPRCDLLDQRVLLPQDGSIYCYSNSPRIENYHPLHWTISALMGFSLVLLALLAKDRSHHSGMPESGTSAREGTEGRHFQLFPRTQV